MLREKSSTGTLLIGDNRKFCAQNGKYLVKGGSIHLEIYLQFDLCDDDNLHIKEWFLLQSFVARYSLVSTKQPLNND